MNNETKTGGLLGLYQQILQQGQVRLSDSQAQQELLLSGLVIKQGSHLKVRNPIYQAVFSSDWVKEELSKLRPYAEAFNAWLDSGCEDESRLLRGKALQEAQNWSKSRQLSNEDYQFLSASENLDRREVQQALEAKRLQAVEAQLIAEKQSAQRRNILMRGLSMALLLACSLGAIAFGQFRQATLNEINTLAGYSQTFHLLDRSLDALVAAIRSEKKRLGLGWSNRKTLEEVNSALGQAVYDAIEYNRLRGHQDGVWEVDFSPDGQLIVSASWDQTIKLWQKDGTLLKTFPGHEGGVLDVKFSADGELIISAGWDQTIKLWQKDGTLIKTLSGHEAPVRTLAISPDGELIASGSRDKTIRLWNSDGSLLKTLVGHQERVWVVAFSPDGQLIASGSDDKTIKL